MARERRVGRFLSPLALTGLLAAVGLPAQTLAAQGTLSTQGFGNPVGGLSPRSAGTAGSNVEFDPLASGNPAALNGFGRAIIGIAYEPEFRRVQLGDADQFSRVQRVPMLAVGGRVRRFALMLSTHTLLDRSWRTVSDGTATIGGQSVVTRDETTARGAMNDVRLAAATILGRLRVGAGMHAVVGEHEVVRSRAFPDTLQFGGVLDTSRIGFAGYAASVGADLRLSSAIVLAGSWKKGFTIDARADDVTRSEATVPDRLALGIAVDGIPGAAFSANVEQVTWSSLDGLGSDAARGHDALNWAVGAELIGGSFRDASVIWRAGYAQRELAFLLDGKPVDEQRLAIGFGLPLSGDTGVLDVAAARALRRISGSDARENAWVITVGLRIRP